MVEILKQGQYVPMTLGEQILVLYAGTQGFLDDVAVEKVKEFESGLLSFVKSQKKDVLDEIEEKKNLDETLKGKLNDAINAFKGTFQA